VVGREGLIREGSLIIAGISSDTLRSVVPYPWISTRSTADVIACAGVATVEVFVEDYAVL
jgi:hypothetical protein